MTYARVASSREGLRLHLNENTAGCSPAVMAALRSLDRADVSAYPDYAAVTAKCEAWFGVPPGWVQITNGLDEGLHVAAQSARLADINFEAIVIEPAFEMYAACIAAAGGRAVTLPPAVDLAFSVEAVLGALTPQTRLIYICDPGNPAGLPVPPGDVARLAQAAPAALVLVDEAYADFSGRTLIGPALDRLRNVVVGRSFSKAHGLAALRAGVLVGHPEALAPLRRLLAPYSVNVCAAVALEAALDDDGYVRGYVAQSVESRALIYDWCRTHRLRYWPSEANFVLVRIGGHATAFVEALARQGVHVRDRSRLPGCAGCVRITAGFVSDTRRCLAVMEAWHATRDR